MATTKNGLLRGLSGKVGPIVVCKGKDKSIVKILPKKTTKAPKLPQLSQRAIFKMVKQFIDQTQQVMRIGYYDYLHTERPLNAATAYHLKNAVIGVYPDFTMDAVKIKVSRDQGGLKQEFNATVSIDAGDILKVSWDFATIYNPFEMLKRKLDQAVLLIFDETKQLTSSRIGEVTRAAGKLEVSLPKAFQGDQLHCYFFFAAEDGKVSNTQYLGVISNYTPSMI
ncbi:DUF6266 family protein [Pedobacter sp. L105]|uniref:DUF6266 family protein n=1 Tax=Pedobacter sp. L105 TaxID=1641871 RepID=UPI00131A7FE8|nr:DUF6266 family protein [Pedobacter sp. L105]